MGSLTFLRIAINGKIAQNTGSIASAKESALPSKADSLADISAKADSLADMSAKESALPLPLCQSLKKEKELTLGKDWYLTHKRSWYGRHAKAKTTKASKKALHSEEIMIILVQTRAKKLTTK